MPKTHKVIRIKYKVLNKLVAIIILILKFGIKIFLEFIAHYLT